MFSLSAITEHGFDKILLADEGSKTCVSIVPACGAMLYAFEVQQEDGVLNIVDHYSDISDFKINQEKKGFKSAKLSPFVCRMKDGRYNFAEQDYKIQKFYLGENAIHGLLYDAIFTVTNQYASETSAFIEMHYYYRGTDPGYPFHYECIVSYELKTGNSLTVETTIINRDEGYIPVSDGWHPYFSFGQPVNNLLLEFQSKEALEFDSGLIPTGNLAPYQQFGALKKIEDVVFDNCFTLNFAECQPMAVLRDPSRLLQLEIYPDKSYPYLQIYIPPDRKTIAIENLSSAPDSFNNKIGLITAAPGSHTVFKTVYKIREV